MKRLLATFVLIAGLATVSRAQAPYGTNYSAIHAGFAAPWVTAGSGLAVNYTAGTLYQGGSSVAITATTGLTVTASQSSCVAPAYTACNFIYWTSGTTLSATTTYATAVASGNILVAYATTGASAVTAVIPASLTQSFPYANTFSDSTYIVPLASCSLYVSTGALGAAPAGSVNPGTLRVAANQNVLQAITTAAANTVAFDCDITPPSRLTAGRGVTVNNVQLFYGVQTTALTSITAPTISTQTFPATGAAAGNTVAAAGGTLTVTPGTLQLATTTSGQCYSENIVLGTPVAVVTDLQRLTLEELFNQSGAAATQLQICGVIVHYTNVPL